MKESCNSILYILSWTLQPKKLLSNSTLLMTFSMYLVHTWHSRHKLVISYTFFYSRNNAFVFVIRVFHALHLLSIFLVIMEILFIYFRQLLFDATDNASPACSNLINYNSSSILTDSNKFIEERGWSYYMLFFIYFADNNRGQWSNEHRNEERAVRPPQHLSFQYVWNRFRDTRKQLSGHNEAHDL